MQQGDGSHAPWLVLVYREPSEGSNARVSVWRDLKRLGVLYLQQCVCIVPGRPDLRAAIDVVREKIANKHGGSSNLFEVPSLPPDEEAQLANGFRDLVAKQYAEIVEECETKFVKEIEYEIFRQNFTFAEAEEIEQDLEKIRRWLVRVEERDWFAAPGRDEVGVWLERCEALLEDFYLRVHAHTTRDVQNGPDAADLAPGIALPRLAAVPKDAGSPPAAPRRKRGEGKA